MGGSIRQRVLLLALVPLLVLAVLLAGLSVQQLRSDAEAELGAMRERLIKQKQGELKAYLELAQSTVQSLYDSSASGDMAARDQAIALWKPMRYGSDGYIFGYDGGSVRIFSGQDSKRIGDSFRDYKDVNGVFLINDLVSAGQRGGGYVTYHFPKPGSDTTAYPKLSYAVWLPKWNLMIGTGFYIDDIDRIMAEAEANAAERLQSAIGKTVLLTVIILAVMAVIAFRVANGIVKPIGVVAERMQEIAKGDGDLTQRLRLERQDEIGALAGAFDQFVARIHELMQQVVAVSGRLRQVAGTVETDAGGTFAAIDRQRHETDQVATAVTQLSATVREVARNTHDTAESANRADQQSRGAREVVRQATSAILGLANELDSSVASLQQLQQDTNQVGAVLDVIRGIAEQTNLLALNAAIEAARAGDQGRGFAVVADEVRALAARTQQSTQEIQAMLERFRQSADNAVSGIQRCHDISKVSVDHAERTSAELEQVSTLINQINAMGLQIATAAEEQATVTDSLARNVHQIAEAADQATGGAKRTEQSSRDLSGLGQELQQLVGRFRL